MRKWFIGILWGLLLLAVTGVGVIFWAIADGRIGDMPPIEEMLNPIDKSASQVYSADGKLLGTYSYSRENRVMVSYNELSPSLVQALVATEDARFFDEPSLFRDADHLNENGAILFTSCIIQDIRVLL